MYSYKTLHFFLNGDELKKLYRSTSWNSRPLHSTIVKTRACLPTRSPICFLVASSRTNMTCSAPNPCWIPCSLFLSPKIVIIAFSSLPDSSSTGASPYTSPVSGLSLSTHDGKK
uniref:Uncharacterized protein n=1 Tax=Arundo donax TaxID=35708 RepID=A0A0A9GHS0_ARUDO